MESTTTPEAPMTTTPSYADLVAERNAGTITNTEYYRAMRAHPVAKRVSGAMRRQADAARRYGYDCGRFCSLRRRYSDEQLTIDATGANGAPAARYATELLRLDTVEQRLAAWAGAHRFMGATPDAGRPSDALRSTVNSMLAGYAA